MSTDTMFLSSVTRASNAMQPRYSNIRHAINTTVPIRNFFQLLKTLRKSSFSSPLIIPNARAANMKYPNTVQPIESVILPKNIPPTHAAKAVMGYLINGRAFGKASGLPAVSLGLRQ